VTDTNNRSEFILSFEGDGSDIGRIFSAFKRQVSQDVKDIEALTNITLFRNLKGDLDKAGSAVKSTSDDLAKLKGFALEVQSAGESIGKDLSKGLKDAEKAAASATKEFDKQASAVDRMGKTLQASGVNLRALGTEEIRLATAAKQAAEAEQQRQAGQVLGIRTTRDLTAELAKANAAYLTIKNSGVSSAADVANAYRALQNKQKELNDEIKNGVKGSDSFGASLQKAAVGAILPFASITAVIATVVSTFKSVTDASKQFNQSIAEIGTVTNLSREQLDKLGQGARQVAFDVAVDLNGALKGLFELIRSGVSPDNALEVLRVSARGAKAALADTADGVKVTNLLLDSFGADLGDLPLLFDKITAAAHNGGATLKEFGNSAGQLLNVGRAAGFEFDDLLAVLTVLVDKSGNAEKSFSDLTKIIAKIDTTEAREKLRVLEITGTSLTEIFQQIGAKGRTLNDVLGLGLSGAGAKGAAGIATLTNNSKELPAVLDKIRSSAGETTRSLAQLLDTPKERSDRFNAEIDRASVSLGNLFGSGSRLAQIGTFIVRQFNEIPAAFDAADTAAAKADASFISIGRAFLQFSPLAAEAAERAKGTGDAVSKLGGNAAAAEADLKRATASLKEFGDALIADIKKFQDAATTNLTDIQSRADAQIAALDRGRLAQAATDKATLDIILETAAAKLKIIQDNEEKITQALNIAIAAREKLAKQAGDSDKKIASDSAAVRIQSVQGTLAAYQALYAQLLSLQQTESARFRSIEEARVDIVTQTRNLIRDIRLSELSGLDQYVARMAEIDRLVSLGRTRAAQGDTEAAKQFFTQAINESNGLTEVISKNGAVVISSFDAKEARVRKLKEIQDEANKAFIAEGDAAKEGAGAAVIAAEKIQGKIKELQKQYDDLKATVADGLKLRVDLDEKGVNDAFAKLADLTKDRHVKIIVDEVKGVSVTESSPNFVGPPSPFAAGGPVQGFAGGGSVFRRPTWMKVPGTGNADTVPAALSPGSFVVRKAAAQYYGDGMMSALARGLSGIRGFASGGIVTKDEFDAWARKEFGFNPANGNPDRPGGGGPVSPFAGGNNPFNLLLPQADKPRDLSQAPAPDHQLVPFKSGDSFQKDILGMPVSVNIPRAPDEFKTAANLIAYAKEMLQFASQLGGGDYLIGILKPWILDAIKRLDRNPGDKEALDFLLQDAETIGLNPYGFSMWEATTSHAITKEVQPISFLDWLIKRGVVGPDGAPHPEGVPESGEFAKRFFGLAITDDFFQGFASRFLTGGGGTKKVNRRFALGGATGTDTVPALLTPGEAVISQPAVAHAERVAPGLLNAINSIQIPRELLKGIARFASGGLVQPGGPGGRLLLGGKGKVSLGAFTNEFADLLDPLVDLKEKARDLPKSASGIDLSEWASRVLDKFEDFDEKRKQKIKEVVEQGLEGWQKAIESARRFRTPAVMDADIAKLAFNTGGLVPAMLTPGESVLPPVATSQWGAGLLHAINAIAISRDTLSSLIAPPTPRRYADGGIVFEPSQVSVGASGSGNLSGLTMVINASAEDILSERNIRNWIIPVLRQEEKRSR